ncbi:MAG TPA: hypothetical protein VIY08_14685 [Candidatus Nitrosocosmicus sp.]
MQIIEIYVANQASNIVSVISESTNTVIGTINVGPSISSLAYDSNNGNIYVANMYSNTVSVINDFNNNVIGTINVGVQG